MKIEHLLSEQHRNMKRSEIRELLKLTQLPGIISFGGGLPDPALFPVRQIREVSDEVLKDDAINALQYGTTEGDAGLKAQLLKRYQKMGFNISENNLMIVTGSQQALDLCGKIFINPGDPIICEAPSYLGSLGAFLSYGADIRDVPLDDSGIDFESMCQRYDQIKIAHQTCKFIYLIPDYQNPSGIHMSLERRKEVIAFAEKNDILIVEDSPYKEFNFEGHYHPSLYEMSNQGQVIHFGTFSKTFMPGFRIAWIIASEEIIDRFVIAKQNTDLCSSPLSQKIIARFMAKGYFDEYLLNVKAEYKKKRDAILHDFEELMPNEVTWNSPNGGLFLFIQLPDPLDSAELFKKAIERGVAYVPGRAFFVNGKGKNFARINFSYSSIEKNREGVKRLSQVIRDELKRSSVYQKSHSRDAIYRV